jgi:hypothetical protein
MRGSLRLTLLELWSLGASQGALACGVGLAGVGRQLYDQ